MPDGKRGWLGDKSTLITGSLFNLILQQNFIQFLGSPMLMPSNFTRDVMYINAADFNLILQTVRDVLMYTITADFDFIF